MHDFTVLRSLHCGQDLRRLADARCVVAIPVRNEERSIVRCLDALSVMGHRETTLLTTVLLLNGCTDGTWDAVVRQASATGLPVTMVEASLGPTMDHAGGARAVALGLAMDALSDRRDGVILTTDADTRVPPDWLDRALEGLEAGCDVVAGDFDVDVASRRRWPEPLQKRVTLEERYGQLLDEVDNLCDPVPHNPWPSHRRCSGANLVFRASALAALPTIPSPRCGEDRALVAACLARDLRVRHDPNLRVSTSGRLAGRAHGGMADTLRLQHTLRETPCDDMLEALTPHVHRAMLRSHLRGLFQPGLSAAALVGAAGFVVPGNVPHRMPCHFFGDAWQQIEGFVPKLVREPLSPIQLPGEIAAARTWLAARASTTFQAEVAA